MGRAYFCPYEVYGMLDLKLALNKLLGRCDGLTVGLFGYGRTSKALLPLIKNLPDVRVVIRDEKESPEPLTDLPVHAHYLGSRAYDEIHEDVLILSPSVRRDDPRLVRAEMHGTRLTSECELFFLTECKTLGVTGSDGKSTTTALASSLLLSSGYSASAVGNIGIPYSLAENSDIYVAELSSFNLTYTVPKLLSAVITNITPNHLNWHKSYGEYKEAKLNILRHAERTVLSYDDPETRHILYERGSDFVTSVKTPYRELPRLSITHGIYTVEDGFICRNGVPLSDTSEYIRREEHTLANMLSAAALTDGLADRSLLHGVFSNFRGLPHRCEYVGRARGIDFYNSSIDTSPARTARTLASFSRPVLLLLGGRGKGLSYEPLIRPIAKYAKRVAIYGEEAAPLLEFLSSAPELSSIEISVHERFDCAFEALIKDRTDGCVLLSPAATAYGEFSDFEERGRRFSELVAKLKTY